jgi:hypothetical protein
MRINGSTQFLKNCKNAGKDQLNLRLLLLFISIISALFLVLPGAAQSGYEIRNAVVTPEYGYEDFSYSAQVWMSEQAASKVGIIAVTRFSLKLNIYNNGELIHSESSDQTGMGKTSFSFGPYSFKDRFGIEQTSNATFEYVFYAGGQQVAKTPRLKGPIVQPPAMTGTPAFEKNPYFFQDISVSAGFRDLEGLDPKPVCHLEITGPLGTNESRSWNTDDVPCRSSGKSAYTCTLKEDLSAYRDGGNFSFNIVYSNLKVDPLTFGPYNVSLRTYSPAVERLNIARLLDYTNFSIQATVRDAAAGVEGSSPEDGLARLVIFHPQKGEISFSSSEPQVSGERLVYTWTNENDPALFNRSDVQVSKTEPLQARIEYENEKWDYAAKSSNVSFRVIEEIPRLDLQYPADVYVSSGESSSQEITATVIFAKGPGDMNFRLSGPALSINQTDRGTALGGNRYQYRWPVTFDDRHVNNNYTLSLSFAHNLVEGGRYDFEDKTIHVSPINVQFSDSAVAPAAGLWNDSYSYSLQMNSTVPLKVQLQTYDPCSNEWIKKESKEAFPGSSSLDWTLKPFGYECREMAEQGAKYRFKASFAGEEIASSRAYEGPAFLGAKPTLVSLDSDPVVYVSEGSESSSSVQAVVEYAAGQGQAILRLEGPEKSIEKSALGIALGAGRYRYDWSLPFEAEDVGKSFNYTIGYAHSSLAEEMWLAERTIAVQPVAITFGEANVAPDSGRWNDSYAYLVPVDASVDMKVALEVYNPCSREWVERASAAASPGGSLVNLTAKPFKYKCAEAEGKEASYRFAALFAGERIVSDVYSGPMINGGKPELVSLEYTPVLYVAKDSTAYQVIRATIESTLGPGRARLSIKGPEMDFEEELDGAFLGGEHYTYTWSMPFGPENVGEHAISLSYLNQEIPGGEVSFPTESMTVIEETVPDSSQPQLLYLDYSPILYIEGSENVLQNITAEVFSPEGKGELNLAITGPDKKAADSVLGEEKGEGVYIYRWSEPYDATNIGKSYTISSTYLLGKESYAFNDRIMSVAGKDDTVPQIWEPALNLRYDPIVDIPAAADAEGLQHIKATVIYPDGVGDLRLNISGEKRQFEETLQPASSSENRSLYEKNVPFNSTHAGKSYKISLSYLHPDLPGGEYRFTDYFMRVRLESGPNIAPTEELPEIKGYVSPERGVLQAWQEKDRLYSFTYTAEIENLSSGEMPWVELSVKAPGRFWKLVGEKQQYDPAHGNLSWTVKPFYDTEFIGTAEFKFLVDGRESEVFKGPEIVAIYKDLSYQKSTIPNRFNYLGKINSSINLTVDLLSSGDNLNWRNIGKPQKYIAGSNEVPMTWKDQTALRYFEFDIKPAAGEVIS